MSTHHAILGLLSLGERCGYELRQDLESFDVEWKLEFGQLYRLLKNLERRGLVTARSGPGYKGPQRTLYELTQSGREELESWLSEPVAQIRERRDELPLKLKVGRALGVHGIDALIAVRRGTLEAQRTETVEERERARNDGDHDRGLVIETRLRHIEGSINALASYATLSTCTDNEGVGNGELSETIFCAGSDDPVLTRLAQCISRQKPGAELSTRAVGSLGGLLILREGGAHMAGTHLLDVESGEYNVPFIKRLLFEEPVVLVNLSHREQGLMVAPDNPKQIAGVADIVRKDVRLINRQRGAGTRLLLHSLLRQEGIEPHEIEGFHSEVPTHESVANAVSNGEVDVGMGIRAVAQQMGLDFIPVGLERYDLAVPKIFCDSPLFQPVLEVLHLEDFRREISNWGGYDVSQMGDVVAEVH